MPNILKKCYSVSFIMFLLCCTTQKDDLIIEKEVFAALLSDMVDSVYKDPALYLNPLPKEKMLKNEDASFSKDGKHPSIQQKIKTSNTETEISVLTSIKPVSDEDTANIKMTIRTHHLKIVLSKNRIVNRLDLSTCRSTRYRFINLSNQSLGENLTPLEGKKVHHVGISFSRIQFDKKKENGILTSTYLCYPRCGIGYVIIVHRNKNGWKIQKVIQTWIS